MTKRSQTSVDFLFTYGWMFLVVLLAGGALAALGFFDTQKFIPSQCNMGFDFSCEKYVILTSGEVRVQLENNVGEEVTINEYECEYPSDPSPIIVTGTASGGNTWAAGTTKDFTCNLGLSFEEGTREEVTIRLTYQKTSGGFAKEVEGSVAAVVSA